MRINYASWATAGISTTDGAVFWIDQANAPGSGAVIAQITSPCGSTSTAVVSAQGTSTVGADWQAANLTFNWPAFRCARYGCTGSAADNYDSTADRDDGSCLYTGCMDSRYDNYDTQANVVGYCAKTGCMESACLLYTSPSPRDRG